MMRISTRVGSLLPTHLVENKGRRRLTRHLHKFLEFLTLDDLAGGVARVRREHDFEALCADVLAKLIEVHPVLVLQWKSTCYHPPCQRHLQRENPPGDQAQSGPARAS